MAIKKLITEETLPEVNGRTLQSTSLLLFKEKYYTIEMLLKKDDFVIDKWLEANKEEKDTKYEFNYTTAYIDEEYFYLYRGAFEDTNEHDTPGIYTTDDGSYVLVSPITEEDKKLYRHADKISSMDANDIIEKVTNQEIVIFNTPDTVHSAIPPESAEEDILKRLMKRAIHNKGIDIDAYRSRFINKNMLFNTKQVLRGPSRLSMLLFDRCADAFNLKYTIIVEEFGGETVGVPLNEPIIISSADVYESNPIVESDSSVMEDDEF